MKKKTIKMKASVKNMKTLQGKIKKVEMLLKEINSTPLVIALRRAQYPFVIDLIFCY